MTNSLRNAAEKKDFKFAHTNDIKEVSGVFLQSVLISKQNEIQANKKLKADDIIHVSPKGNEYTVKNYKEIISEIKKEMKRREKLFTISNETSVKDLKLTRSSDYSNDYYQKFGRQLVSDVKTMLLQKFKFDKISNVEISIKGSNGGVFAGSYTPSIANVYFTINDKQFKIETVTGTRIASGRNTETKSLASIIIYHTDNQGYLNELKSIDLTTDWSNTEEYKDQIAKQAELNEKHNMLKEGYFDWGFNRSLNHENTAFYRKNPTRLEYPFTATLFAEALENFNY